MFKDIDKLHSLVSWRNRHDKRGVFEPRAVVTRGAKPAGIFNKRSPNKGIVINARPIPNVTSKGQVVKNLEDIIG